MRFANRLTITLFSVFALSAGALAAQPTTLRWAEGNPGCNFIAGDDGKYRYGLWTADFGVVLAVDAQELEKSRRRPEHFLSFFLTVRNRSNADLSIATSKATIAFISHYKEIQVATSPDDLSAALLKDADSAAQQSAKEIQKHPSNEAALRSSLALRQQDIDEMRQFLKTHSLEDTTLAGMQPEISGWIYFTPHSKWIGDWKSQEELVLHIPVGGTIVEFPLVLPPSRDNVHLRTRPSNEP